MVSVRGWGHTGGGLSGNSSRDRIWLCGVGCGNGLQQLPENQGCADPGDQIGFDIRQTNGEKTLDED